MSIFLFLYYNTYYFLKDNSKGKNGNVILLTFSTTLKLSPYHPQIHGLIKTDLSCLLPDFHLGLCACISLCLTEPPQTLLKYPFLVLLQYCSINI